jgi:hypothetical protein
MNSTTVSDSLVKHLDVIEKSLWWALGIAVIIGWAGIRKADPIDILGMKTTRSDAYFVASWAFVLANLAIVIALLRMADLLKLLSDADFSDAVQKIMTHSFLFNPFSYFGTGLWTRVQSSIGYGLLIVCWWTCYTAIATLGNFSSMPRGLEVSFLGAGAVALTTVHRCLATIQGKLYKNDPQLAVGVIAMNRTRGICAVIGALGAELCFSWFSTRCQNES